MKTYITKPKSIRKSQILGNDFSLSGFSFRVVEFKNNNFEKVEKLLIENKKGFEAGSDEYINFSDNYFVRISDLNNLNFTFDLKPDTQKIRPPKNTNKLAKGDICYQTASDVGNVCIYGNETPSFYNSHIRKLKFDESIKFYIFGILKSNFGKNQVDVAGSIKGVDNFREEYLLNTKIPFPTTANHQDPQKIQDLVSVLVQNIIDKEEQIKAKNIKIDEMIGKELKENQKENTFSYKLPRISEIKAESRLDTGLYERDYKDISNQILNYKNKFYFLDQNKIKPGQTPADYIFSEYKKNDQFKDWITPKNVDGRTLSFRTFIRTKTLTKVKENSLILNGIRYVGNGILADKNSSIYCNQNTLIINQFNTQTQQVFLLCFLTSNYGKTMQMIQRNFGIVPILYAENLCKVPIPSFPEIKQEEIAKEYYNLVPKNEDLTLENYLEEEKVRNSQLGIFQLNMEIFELREKLEELIDKIVNEKSIEINF